ncbi:DUF3566 domain-containing protein [Actinokineospora xionganensis]|uniref:DUF3566 domain-containing protein n=1 Tax=Actinokineospora xionganensis TaxID=2684470 RepID=A0ABR7L9B4_9PSEU|nr:DUF3566 domain-containing protein [Actinokineospora xionganensis]
MTPPDKPDTNAPEQSAEERASVATSKVEPVAEPATAEPEAPAAETTSVNPPPWQRVTADEAYGDTGGTTETLSTDGETTQALPVNGIAEAAYQPHIAAPATERPVVTGSAASRLFGNPEQEAPHRTAVHLDPGVRTTPPPSALRRPGRGPRRANLQIKRFDPWSVLKLSLVLGVALFFVWLVAVGALYAVLDGMGVWDKLNGISSELLNAGAESGSTGDLISAGRVFGVAAIIGAINIVLFSALATVGAFIYNVSADLAGGLEVTLAERE